MQCGGMKIFGMSLRCKHRFLHTGSWDFHFIARIRDSGIMPTADLDWRRGMGKRFYGSYTDEGTSTMSDRHGVIEAESWEYAMEHWQQIIHAAGFYCKSLGGDHPTALFELPPEMCDWPEQQVLAYYRDTDFKGQWAA